MNLIIEWWKFPYQRIELAENEGRKKEKRREGDVISLNLYVYAYFTKNDDDKWTVDHMGPIAGVTSLMQIISDFDLFLKNTGFVERSKNHF